MVARKKTSRPVAKKKTGRKSKLEIDPRLTRALCRLIEEGVPIKFATSLAGVSEPSFHRWMDLGEKEDAEPLYRDFRESVTRARGKKISKLLKILWDASKIKSHVTGQLDWKAALMLLERTEREHFGATTKTEITGKDGKPVEVGVQSFAELLAKAREA